MVEGWVCRETMSRNPSLSRCGVVLALGLEKRLGRLHGLDRNGGIALAGMRSEK
jgi:hypothetical protein